MSFQVNSTDLQPDTEIKESVTTAEKEFKNSTEETERKLVPEDEEEFKNSTEETERKLVPEDEEEFKKTITKKLKRKLVPEDEEEFKKTITKKLKRKLVPEDEDDEDSGGSGLVLPQWKPVLAGDSGHVLPQKLRFNCLAGGSGHVQPQWRIGYPCEIITINPHLEDKDEDEEKEMSRTQSMDNLALMKEPLQQ